LNTSTGTGNFFLKPNGVFYLTRKNKAVVCATEALPQSLIGIRFATQSGPMLVQDGHIHSAFNRESSNMVIRNGVGILPNGDILCVISNTEVTLFEIAEYFVRAGCKNALYLDGYVSRLYAPSLKRDDVQGTLGPILAVVE
jgi:uncharacterized protein YigE (DUF2233 family)